MGLLARILGSVRSLFGGTGSDDESPESSADTGSSVDEPAADASGTDADSTVRRCPVCGTDVEPDGEACPLCGSTDPSPADPAADGSPPSSPGPETVATDGEGTEDAAERLRELRDE